MQPSSFYKTFCLIILAGLFVFNGCDGIEEDDPSSPPEDMPAFEACLQWLASSTDQASGLPEVPCSEDVSSLRKTLLTDGGGIFPVDENMYYLVRFPSDWERLEEKNIIFALHGQEGCAEEPFQDWIDLPAAETAAVVSLQYYDPTRPYQLERHDDDRTLYEHLSEIVQTIEAHCPVQDSLKFLYGFSRGSTETFSLAYWDGSDSGSNMFSAFIADSGAWPIDGPLPDTLQQVVIRDDYRAFSKARFWTYCNEAVSTEHERAASQDTCEALEGAAELVETYGGTVDRFYSSHSGGFGIFSGPDTDALSELMAYIESL